MTIQDDRTTPAQMDELDPNSMAAIRDLLASEEPVEATPETDPVNEIPQRDPVPARPAVSDSIDPPHPQQTDETDTAVAAMLAEEPEVAKPARKRMKAPRAAGEPGIMDRLKARITGYRPTPRHIVIATLTLLVVFRPWLALGLLFLTLFIFTGVLLMFGYDGFWRAVMRSARWYARRRPARSAEIHRKLDDFAMNFDAFLDRFPEGSVDGLYLPDLSDMAEADARHEEALDRRFQTLRESEA